ncbi:hypothetical protein [Streptomyces lavendulocolor]|uniref:hypothetical protein n=1 Tax=Streptomyces lavendulocolor TaxID=67316 RepID=UPI003C2ACC03
MKAVQAKDQIAQAAAIVASRFQAKTPEAVTEKASQVTQAARQRRGPLLAVAALVLLVLVKKRRNRGRR